MNNRLTARPPRCFRAFNPPCRGRAKNVPRISSWVFLACPFAASMYRTIWAGHRKRSSANSVTCRWPGCMPHLPVITPAGVIVNSIVLLVSITRCVFEQSGARAWLEARSQKGGTPSTPSVFRSWRQLIAWVRPRNVRRNLRLAAQAGRGRHVSRWSCRRMNSALRAGVVLGSSDNA
jgi:hypothetical protein